MIVMLVVGVGVMAVAWEGATAVECLIAVVCLLHVAM